MDMARDVLVLLFIIVSAAKTADAASTTDAGTTTEETSTLSTYTGNTNESINNSSTATPTTSTETSPAQVPPSTPNNSSTAFTTITPTEGTTSSSTDVKITNTTTNNPTPTIIKVSTTVGDNNSPTSSVGSSSSTQPSSTSTFTTITDSSTTERSTTLSTLSTSQDNGTANSAAESTGTTSDASNLSSTSTPNGSTPSTISTSHLTTGGITTDDTSNTSPSGTTSSDTTTSSGDILTTTTSAYISDNPTTTSKPASPQTTDSSTTSTITNTGTTLTVPSTVSSSESSSEPTTPTTKATVKPTTASSSTVGTAKPGYSTVAPNNNAVFNLTLTVKITNGTTVDYLKQRLEEAFKNIHGYIRVVIDTSDSKARRKRAADDNGAQTYFSAIFDANQNINITEVKNAIDTFNGSSNYTLTGTTLERFEKVVHNRCEITNFCRNGFICLNKGKCYSKCASTVRDCRNGGTCFVSVDETTTKTLCQCKPDEFYQYEGEFCETKVMKWELAVAIAAGTGGALVIILLFIIIILCAKRSSDKDSKYKYIKNSGDSRGAFVDDAELNVYRQRQSTKYKESGLDQVDLQPGYDNKAYDFESLPDSDSQGNSSFLHPSSSKRWDPDASSETYAKIYRQLEDTNYQVGIKRPQFSTRRNEALTGF